MNIRLLRNRDRALFLPADRSLMECPLDVRQWLGQPEHEAIAVLAPDTPMVGISPSEILEELRRRQWCALDSHRIVRAF